MPYAAGHSAKRDVSAARWCCSRRVPRATWLFWMMKIAGARLTAAKFSPSCATPALVLPSPIQVMATCPVRRTVKESAMPVTIGTMSPTWLIGATTPCASDP